MIKGPLFAFFLVHVTYLAAQPGTGVVTLTHSDIGKAIAREIKPDETHSYQFHLVEGEYLRGAVEQHGIDVELLIFSPSGEKVAAFDSPNGTEGPEPFEVVAKAPGLYRVDVHPLDENTHPGRYEFKVSEMLTSAEYLARLQKERAQYESVVGWIRTNAIPLETVVARHGFRDMQPLKQVVGDARIVSLGEATHGTREFFQFKHRMLEFLVSEMGFTVFAIEATMPESFDVNQYVLTGEGDLDKALAGLYFWTWDTEEVADMIRWMREYNKDPNHVRKVKFYGFDMQSAPRAVRIALEYLQAADPAQAAQSRASLARLMNPMTDLRLLPRDQTENLGIAANSLLTALDAHREPYIQRTSESEWAVARQCARMVVQNVEMNTVAAKDMMRSSFIRDRSMAENIGWILEREGAGAKVVVWAHNGHVAKDENWMGDGLQKKFGSSMVVVGFSFYEGSFRAVEGPPFPSMKGLHSFQAPPSAQGSIDRVLADAGLQFAVVDLRRIPKDGAVSEWFSGPHRMRSIGAIYSDAQGGAYDRPVVAPRIYDAIFFVRKTEAALGTPTGQIPAVPIFKATSNGGFEQGSPGSEPPDWIVRKQVSSFGYEVAIETQSPADGEQCAVIARRPGRQYGESVGRLEQYLSAEPYVGKRIRLRAAVRAAVAGDGSQAQLWLRVFTRSGVFTPGFYDDMADRPITSAEWHSYEIIADVPKDATVIDYGLALVGDGRAWLDSVSVSVVER